MDLLAPIDASGNYVPGPLVPIEEVHRKAILHRGLWLHVMSSDHSLLVMRRAATMATCPSLRSIIGEHHSGREHDDHCAKRALREELPGLVRAFGSMLIPVRLRERPRWFLYDYAPSNKISRFDRCLITEYLLFLPANASTSLAALRAGRDHEVEHEASDMVFVPIHELRHELQNSSGDKFCAQELLAPSLLDTLDDICRLVLQKELNRPTASLDIVHVAGCRSHRERPLRPAMREALDLLCVIREGQNREARRACKTAG